MAQRLLPMELAELASKTKDEETEKPATALELVLTQETEEPDAEKSLGQIAG